MFDKIKKKLQSHCGHILLEWHKNDVVTLSKMKNKNSSIVLLNLAVDIQCNECVKVV